MKTRFFPIFLIFAISLVLLLSGCISGNKPLSKNNLEEKIPCFEGYAKDVKLCFFDDQTEKFAFIENCKDYPPMKFTKVQEVTNYAECKTNGAIKYNKIAPTFIQQENDYPDYNKCDDKICLICEYHCNVNPDLLDWRFEKLTHVYDKLAKLLGREKLLDIPITYVIYSKEIETLGPVLEINNYFIPVATGAFGEYAKVYSPEGSNFKDLVNNAEKLNNSEKILHKDYPDEVYLRTFEDEETSSHEMLHAVFNARYGGFSYNSTEEHFTQVIGPILAGYNSYVEFKSKSFLNFPKYRYYDSFCDEVFKYGGFPKLYYLCKEYGFDIDDLPALFDELDKLKEKNLLKNPQLGGKLFDDDFEKALSTIIGQDISKFWNNACLFYPDISPECNKASQD